MDCHQPKTGISIKLKNSEVLWPVSNEVNAIRNRGVVLQSTDRLKRTSVEFHSAWHVVKQRIGAHQIGVQSHQQKRYMQ